MRVIGEHIEISFYNLIASFPSNEVITCLCGCIIEFCEWEQLHFISFKITEDTFMGFSIF